MFVPSAGAIAEDVYLAPGYAPLTGLARSSDLKRSGKLVPLKDKYGNKRIPYALTIEPC